MRSDWAADAFFADGEGDSDLGGSPPWHAVSPRWGHSMHPMCSYHGMFPARLVHYFLSQYTKPGDLVVDPFSGRGTTVLQARVEGRRALANDLSPLAYVLSRAKAAPPSWNDLLDYIRDLESQFALQRTHICTSAPPEIRMLFHPNVLEQIEFLRAHMHKTPVAEWNDLQCMVAGALAGILHGGHRSDGSSAYLSISMPNTFSMSPGYVRRYIEENGLKPPAQNVFECLRHKVARLYLDAPGDTNAEVHLQDAVTFLGATIPGESVDLVITSPPYLKVVNYGTSNWIRLWWLGVEDVSRDGGSGRQRLDGQLDHAHGYEAYCEFMSDVFRGIARVLREDGIAAVVIGDVARSTGDTLILAEAVWAEVGSQSGLQLIETVDDEIPINSKVSRIWGDTKGRATDCDRVLVLGRADGRPRTSFAKPEWSEPYKDAGPDAAHSRVSGRTALRSSMAARSRTTSA